jgi:hypothetical protein
VLLVPPISYPSMSMASWWGASLDVSKAFTPQQSDVLKAQASLLKSSKMLSMKGNDLGCPFQGCNVLTRCIIR